MSSADDDKILKEYVLQELRTMRAMFETRQPIFEQLAVLMSKVPDLEQSLKTQEEKIKILETSKAKQDTIVGIFQVTGAAVISWLVAYFSR